MRYVDAIIRSDLAQQALAPLGQLPMLSWATIFVGAILATAFFLVALSLVRSVVGLLRSGKTPAPLMLVSTDGGYVRINWADDGADWLGGTKLTDKESGLLLTYIGDDGRKRRARGTVRFTKSQGIPSGTVGIPDDIAAKLELQLGDNPASCQIQIAAVKRFFFENLWNNGDDAIKISFKTTVWVTLISTLMTVIVGYVFEYLLCRACLK